LLSAICEAFGCTPSQALSEDWDTVHRVLEYRAAQAAVDTFNQKDRKTAFKRLEQNPGLAEILARMQRAQMGAPLAGADLAAEGADVFRAHAAPVEGEEA